MPFLQQRRYAGEFVLSEGEGLISRDDVTIQANASGLVAGQILGMVTATGKWVPHNPAATDGSQDAAAVLFSPLPVSAVDQPGVIFARYAEVIQSMLVYNAATIAPADFALVKQQLAVTGIIVR